MERDTVNQATPEHLFKPVHLVDKRGLILAQGIQNFILVRDELVDHPDEGILDLNLRKTERFAVRLVLEFSITLPDNLAAPVVLC